MPEITPEVKTLTELVYMEDNPDKKWEDLHQTYKDQRYQKTQITLNCLSKMNFCVVNKSQIKKPEDDRFVFNRLVEIIKEFNKGVKKQNMALYPVEELAHRILA